MLSYGNFQVIKSSRAKNDSTKMSITLAIQLFSPFKPGPGQKHGTWSVFEKYILTPHTFTDGIRWNQLWKKIPNFSKKKSYRMAKTLLNHGYQLSHHFHQNNLPYFFLSSNQPLTKSWY